MLKFSRTVELGQQNWILENIFGKWEWLQKQTWKLFFLLRTIWLILKLCYLLQISIITPAATLLITFKSHGKSINKKKKEWNYIYANKTLVFKYFPNRKNIKNTSYICQSVL